MDARIIQKQCIQVVFLIDTNQFYENRGNKTSLNNAFRAISNSVLRMLTYLANREDSDRNKFAWGCQFFKIPLNTHFYSRRSVFREFTRNAFEDFEKQLEEEIFVGVPGKQKSNHKQEGIEVSQAFSLKYALHDASLEYRWDELVLSSPQKVAKHKKRKPSVAENSENDRQTKFVFALLPCPLTSSDLECFCEHRSQFTTSFLKRTLINTGKQDSYLFDSLKASLFWLDSRNLWPVTTTEGTTSSEQERPGEIPIENRDGYNMINETLSLVRGGVISLNCLTNIGGLESSSISQLLRVQKTFVNFSCPSTQAGIKNPLPSEESTVLQKSESVSQKSTPTISPALPYSSCLSFYTVQPFSADNNGKLSTTREDEIIVPLSDLREMSSGPKCLLKMKNLWKSPEKRMDTSVETGPSNSLISSPYISLSWSQSDGAGGTTVYLQNDNIQSETEQNAKYERTQASAVIEHQRALILAAVSKETLTLDLYQSSQVFSCLGLEIPKESEDNPGPTGSKYSLSKWFEQMLFHLCQKKCLLVLRLFDCFAVLEPLTPVMASIRIIHSRKVMTLEKMVAFDGVPFCGSKQDNEEQGGTSELISTHVGKDAMEMESLTNKFDIAILREESDISPNTKPKENGKSAIKCPLELNLHKDSKSLKLFSPNCFEPWYRDLPNRGVSAKFLEQLVSLPEYLLLDESVNLDSALSQLKQLYKSEQNLPPSQDKEHSEESIPTETTKQNVIQGKSKDILGQYKPRTLSILKSIRRVETTGPKDSPRKPKFSQKEVNIPFVPDKEFSSEEDLVVYVQEAYTAAISAATSSLSCAQQIVSLTVHFFKEHRHDNTNITISEIVKTFLGKHLFQSNAKLVKKYSMLDAVDGKMMRRREAQLQSLLRFELEVAFPTAADWKGQGKVRSEGEKREEMREVSSEEDADGESELPEEVQETVDEISHLLSSIPILGDYEELLTFLDNVVLPSYSDTIPYLVKAVFEELGHPVPDHLMSPASSKPSSVKPPSSYQGIHSWGSMDTVPAASTRSRTWSRHPSLADIGQKRLIIQPKKAKTKQSMKKQNDAETEARRARRNLFSDSNKLMRRESVAVMEGISQPRRQSPRKQAQRMDRQSKVLKTRVVRETPGKRQVSQALLLQARRARKLEERCIGRSLSPTVEVIEESPVKPLVGSAPRLIHRPVKKQLPFYSENKGKSKQDKLQEARHFTARITGSSPVEATDIAKKVQMKKSPARSFLKEVCTPSTLGTLGRLRSGDKNVDLGGSPELKRNSVDEQVSEREVSLKRVKLSPKDSNMKGEADAPSQRTPKKKLCLQDEDETKDVLQKGSEGKFRDSSGDSDVRAGQRECLESNQEQHPPKRTTLRTSLKRMFDGAAKRSLKAETKEEKGEVGGESQKVAAETIAVPFTGSNKGGEAPIQEQDTQEGFSAAVSSGSQEDASAGTPATKKRKVKSDSPRLQVLSAVAKSGPASRTPSPRRKASELLASPEMFKQWPRRKLRSTTPSPKGIFRGQKSKVSSESRGKVFGTDQSPGIQRNENRQSSRHLKTRSKTSLNFTEQSGGNKIGGPLPAVPSKDSLNEELERHFSFTSDDDEIEFIKISRTKSHDSMGRTLSSDGEGGSKDREGDSNSFSPVFSGSQSSVEMASPPADQSQFKSPASRTRSKTPSKNQQEGKSTSPVFSFVSTPNSSGIKLTLRKQYLSPGENRGKAAKKSLSTTVGGSASTEEDNQSELESTFSHLSSENDEVFSSLCNDEPKRKILSTPPGSSGKMNCKLSTKGLYDLLHSPFAGSPGRRTKRKQTISVSRKRTRKVIIQDQVL